MTTIACNRRKRRAKSDCGQVTQGQHSGAEALGNYYCGLTRFKLASPLLSRE